MNKINEKVIEVIQDQINKHLSDHQEEIDKAYDTMEEVSISLSCKLTPQDDKIRILTNIAFVESRVKDKGLILV